MPRQIKSLAKERLQKVLDEIPKLKNLKYDSPQFTRWKRNIRVTVTNAFGESSPHIKDIENIQSSLWMFSAFISEFDNQESYVEGLEHATAILQSMLDEVEEYWEEEPGLDSPGTPEIPKTTNTNQVFIIHGRDDGIKNTVARFLEDLGLEVVILQEKPDQGLTIIEKFEQYAQVDFAVALFTPDDVGGLQSDSLQPRSRQNVIFEFGYFIGRHGKNRVRALVDGSIEIPSDYSGVIYIPLDQGESWKMVLIRELKSEGFDIDANLAF